MVNPVVWTIKTPVFQLGDIASAILAHSQHWLYTGADHVLKHPIVIKILDGQ